MLTNATTDAFSEIGQVLKNWQVFLYFLESSILKTALMSIAILP